jgi:hypothetical protein
MARENRLTGGVFTDIVGTQDRISAYDRFLNVNVDLNIPHTDELLKYCDRYKDFIRMMKSNFETLAKLEEVIMQLRSKEMINEEIKLSLVRNEYIYARTLFYREGKGTKDIRVIVGKSEFLGSDLNVLSNTPEVMELAKQKLLTAMELEIKENVNQLKNTL